MIKDNCKHIPLHLLNQMLDNNGQTASGQEYDISALQERANELEERNADDLFSRHMAGLFAQADSMVQAAKAVISKAYETMKANKLRFFKYMSNSHVSGSFNFGFFRNERSWIDCGFRLGHFILGCGFQWEAVPWDNKFFNYRPIDRSAKCGVNLNGAINFFQRLTIWFNY